MPESLDTSESGAPSSLTRRHLIQQATVAGAATAAAGLALSTGLAGTAAATPRPDAATPTRPTAHADDEPFVVRVADARAGELEIFHGHRHLRVRDRKLVAELLRAAR